MTEEKLISSKDAAERLGVGRAMISRLGKKGILERRGEYYTEESVERYAKERKPKHRPLGSYKT